jgi:hypothetical protein
MAIVSPFLSIITLNLHDLNAQSKDIKWLNGLKEKNGILALYFFHKRLSI